jgi:hypothetical protein
MDTKRFVLTLVTVAALIVGTRQVADAAPAHEQRTLTLAAGRLAIDRYATNLRDAVAGARRDSPIQPQVGDCRKRQRVVTCMASWTFSQVRCTVEVSAVADRGVLVEELGEATCAQPPASQPSA